ncbi:MAG: FkbM family methyltransferase [Phycisphaerales bacterium]
MIRRLRGTISGVRRWWRTRRPVVVENGPGKGLRLSLRFASADYTSGRNEEAVQRAFVDLVRGVGDACVLDVGANIGFFALLAAREGKSVVAYEAVPRLAREIERHAQWNGVAPLVRVDGRAVSDSPGTARLTLARHPGGAALDAYASVPDAYASIDVKCTTIDAEFTAGRLDRIGAIKVDVEGAELAALRGAERTLREQAPGLLIEVDASSRDAAESRARAIESYLAGLGYRVHRLEAAYDAAWTVIHLVGVRSVTRA